MRVPDQLRRWAKGSYPLEAATELLLRGFEGRLADTSRPWIVADQIGGYGVDFETLPEQITHLPDAEQRYLLVASSLGEGEPVRLSEVLPGMDRRSIVLVLAAVAHAAGMHADTDFRTDQDGQMHVGADASLFQWPELGEPGPTA